VWQERRRQRMRRLENEVATARANQAELTRRVELFEKIAAAAGVELADPPDPADVPPPLAAAAQDPRQDAPVRLNVEGREFVAVVGGGDGGDPIEWWTAIKHLAARSGNSPRSAPESASGSAS
jgi:hypothetical protein